MFKSAKIQCVPVFNLLVRRKFVCQYVAYICLSTVPAVRPGLHLPTRGDGAGAPRNLQRGLLKKKNSDDDGAPSHCMDDS